MSSATRMTREDRVAGALIGMATGDALGAGYEFASPPRGEVAMIGGGLGDFGPGEWTDDTSMAICIAEVTATGRLGLDPIGERFLAWLRSGPADIGISTAAVLRAADAATARSADTAEEHPAGAAAALAAAAARYLADHPRGGAGNGALMRTAPVALLHLGDDAGLATGARAVAELTHADPLAGDSCVLWCVAIDRAVREGRLDGVHDGLVLLPEARRGRWAEALHAAEEQPLSSFTGNGFTITALQAAYGAVVQTPVPASDPTGHLEAALTAAVRIGGDTDTVAAIAGMVLGARWGAAAVPGAWRALLHGWPGLRARDLEALALRTASHGHADEQSECGSGRERGGTR